MERIPDVSGHRIERGDVAWDELPDGRIQIKKRKFGPAAGKLLAAFRVPPTVTITLDTLGSHAWRMMDGRTVGEIAVALGREHPDEEDIPERLGQYLSTLVNNDLVRFRRSRGGGTTASP